MSSTTLKPLSPHALNALSGLARHGPCPRQEINPGVIDRLMRGNLIEMIERPTPYKTRKGNIPFAQITEAGLAELEKAKLVGR